LCTRDRPGLFSKMVGVFTLHNINVLSGNIFTLKNGLAFDLYDVTNPLDPLREEEMWSKMLQDARQAIEDQLPLDELISRKAEMSSLEEIHYTYHPVERIRVDNEGSDFFTILEVGGGIRTGLLYELAKKIFSLGLDIRFAKVNSDKEKMTGVFYVRDASGQKIYEDSVLEKVRREILGALQ
jgi:[protein-PII] uridylyltransferase